MGAIPNTIRRNGVFYFRRRVPDRLRALIGRPYICVSLQTHRFDEAQRISRALYLKSEELFAIPEQSPGLSEEQIAGLVQDMFQSFLAADNRARLERGAPFDRDLIASQREMFASLAADARRALGENDLNSAAFKVAEIAATHDLSGKLSEIDIRRLQQAVLRVAPDLYAALDARYRGDFNYEPSDALLKPAVNGTDLVTVNRNGQGMHGSSPSITKVFRFVPKPTCSIALAESGWSASGGNRPKQSMWISRAPHAIRN